jgi:hypothetical protein
MSSDMNVQGGQPTLPLDPLSFGSTGGTKPIPQSVEDFIVEVLNLPRGESKGSGDAPSLAGPNISKMDVTDMMLVLLEVSNSLHSSSVSKNKSQASSLKSQIETQYAKQVEALNDAAQATEKAGKGGLIGKILTVVATVAAVVLAAPTGGASLAAMAVFGAAVLGAAIAITETVTEGGLSKALGKAFGVDPDKMAKILMGVSIALSLGGAAATMAAKGASLAVKGAAAAARGAAQAAKSLPQAIAKAITQSLDDLAANVSKFSTKVSNFSSKLADDLALGSSKSVSKAKVAAGVVETAATAGQIGINVSSAKWRDTAAEFTKDAEKAAAIAAFIEELTQMVLEAMEGSMESSQKIIENVDEAIKSHGQTLRTVSISA